LLRGRLKDMGNGQLNLIANFIWGIADDVLRDVYVRGKYRDVILPMVVVRRLDAVLEPTKDAVLKMKSETVLHLSSGETCSMTGVNFLYTNGSFEAHPERRLILGIPALLENKGQSS
jgi:type I restriction-modification system DNA methylase subunit